MRRPLLTKAIEWIPQTVALRSGVYIHLRGRGDAKHFWITFTSPEYMAFVPKLVTVRQPRLTLIDCGAGIGMFSLLVEHLRRADTIPWPDVSYVLVEPSPYHLKRLRRNISANLSPACYSILEGLVGQRSGESTFYQSVWQRWGASVFEKSHFLDREVLRPYIDIGPFLEQGPCVLKLDVEGAEFQLVDTYKHQLSNVMALIVEWHSQFGDISAADAALVSGGLRRVRRRQPGPGLFVDLYMRG